MRTVARVAALLVVLMQGATLNGYSVLAHEAIVDALWDIKLKAILLRQYPNATPDQLKRAHGYAYGGAIIQDLGYYPRGMRTGDFIMALVKESRNLNDLAFALGALSHYVGDLNGHRYATNPGTAILYPKLGKKFGKLVTYEDSPSGHLKTEFGFDVLEVARGNFAPQAYHDFIGFYVAEDALGRAFRDTYGLEINDLFRNFDATLGAYRSAVSRTIPMATRVAWSQKQDDILSVQPGVTHARFVYIMRRSSYEREWGKRRDEPNALERFLGFLLKLLPPIGPLNALRLKVPTPAVEQLFMASFDRSVREYSEELDETAADKLRLEDKNYDVGLATSAGAYRLCDDTQAFWLHELAKKHFATVTPEIAQELTEFYANQNAPIHTKKKAQAWERMRAELAELKASSRALAPTQHSQ